MKQLYILRERQREQSNELVGRLKRLISEALTEEPSASGNGKAKSIWNDTVHPFVMKVFNELMRTSILQTDWDNLEQCDIVVDYFKFVQEMLTLFVKRTNNFRPAPIKTYQIHWFSSIRELLWILLSTSYTCVDSDSFTYFAQKTQDSILSIIESLKLIFLYSKEDQKTAEDDSKRKGEQMLDYLVSMT